MNWRTFIFVFCLLMGMAWLVSGIVCASNNKREQKIRGTIQFALGACLFAIAVGIAS